MNLSHGNEIMTDTRKSARWVDMYTDIQLENIIPHFCYRYKNPPVAQNTFNIEEKNENSFNSNVCL